MKAQITYLLLGLGLIIMQSCTKYPPSSERLLEDLAVITQYDTKVDFNTYKTYSIANYVMKVTDKDTIQIPATSGSSAEAILSQIKINMDARGFTEVAASAKPDLGVSVIYYTNTYVYTYSWGGYWGYPGYGWYYPYYPVYYSSYTAGMADIELADLKNIKPGAQQISLRWNAFIRGLLTGSHTKADLVNSVNQAYTQTPTLKTSGK